MAMTLLAWIFLVTAILLALAALLLPWFVPVDGESMNDEPPTLNTRNDR